MPSTYPLDYKSTSTGSSGQHKNCAAVYKTCNRKFFFLLQHFILLCQLCLWKCKSPVNKLKKMRKLIIIHSLELKYSTLPVITELDKMDEDQPSKLDIMDQSSPKPGHADAGPRSEQQSTWPVTLHYSRPSSYTLSSRPSSHEGARVMVACWMVPR